MLWPVLKRSSWAASETSTPSLLLEDVIDDGLAEGELLLVILLLAPAQGLGRQLAGVGIDQHDAAAVGADRAENQFQNAVEQFVEVEDLADRLAGLVHDGQVGQGVLEPGRGLIGPGEDAAAFGLADGLDDGRGQLDVGPRDHADLAGQVVDGLGGVGPAGTEDEHRLADDDLIAGLQRGLLDLLVVDEGAVGAADVDEHIVAVGQAKLGMAARHLGVVQANLVGRVPADADDRLGQLELLAFVGALDDEHTRHVPGGLGRHGIPSCGQQSRMLGNDSPLSPLCQF